jgi:polyisoprenoid-binding protein YceI
MMGKPVSGWDASVTLNRKDYGVDGPPMIGKAIGDEVTVLITVEADLRK